MLTKEEIFSIYTKWENQFLPDLITRLGMHPSNERQKTALFRVFDSLVWSIAEKRTESTKAKDEAMARRLERASYTLESANIPATRETLSVVVGMVASTFQGELDDAAMEDIAAARSVHGSSHAAMSQH